MDQVISKIIEMTLDGRLSIVWVFIAAVFLVMAVESYQWYQRRRFMRAWRKSRAAYLRRNN